MTDLERLDSIDRRLELLVAASQAQQQQSINQLTSGVTQLTRTIQAMGERQEQAINAFAQSLTDVTRIWEYLIGQQRNGRSDADG
jgi:ribosomal protein S11